MPSTPLLSHPYPPDGLGTPYLGEFDEARYVFNLKGKAERHNTESFTFASNIRSREQKITVSFEPVQCL